MPLIQHARELVASSSSGSLDALQSKLQGVVHSLTVSSRGSRCFLKDEQTELWELICALWNLCVDSNNLHASQAPDRAEVQLRHYARQATL